MIAVVCIEHVLAVAPYKCLPSSPLSRFVTQISHDTASPILPLFPDTPKPARQVLQHHRGIAPNRAHA